MKANNAKLAIILGVGAAVVGTTVKEIENGHGAPSFYVPLAGALVAVPLLIASDFQPDLAGGFGVLILIAAFTYSGSAIANAVTNSTTAVQTTRTANPTQKINADNTVSNIGSNVPLSYNVPKP
jgi:hypothetical protein